MVLKAAFQMDPIESVDIDADTTFAFAFEAQTRGADVWVYEPDKLTFEDGRVAARARKVRLTRKQGEHVHVEAAAILDLRDTDVVFLRQDPPFDMAYITTTHILERVMADTLVLNNPVSVRNAPEKLLVTQFKDVMPPTQISRDGVAIRDFAARHKDIIVKPLYGNGGAGVFRIKPDDGNLNALLEMFVSMSREPVMVQAFLPAVEKGDKRILLIDGEPVGAINRIPAKGETRSNMHVGGRPEPATLSARDIEICKVIGPTLRDAGLVFAGIDVIGDYLTEINVTSPTGVQELKRFGGPDVAALLWDWIDDRAGK